MHFMSERWTNAQGIQGDAIAYLEAQTRQEWERDLRTATSELLYDGGEYDSYFIEVEKEFHADTIITPAMAKAIEAIQKAIKKEEAKAKTKTIIKELTMMNFKKDHELGVEDKIFLKLEDGQTVTGVFRGDIFEFKSHYVESDKRGYDCEGDACPLCEAKIKTSFRFKINFVVKDAKGFNAKIFSGSKTVYRTLRELNDKYGGLHRVKLTISKNSKEKSTTILPCPIWQIPEDVEAQLKQIELLPLNPPLKETEPSMVGDANEDIGW